MHSEQVEGPQQVVSPIAQQVSGEEMEKENFEIKKGEEAEENPALAGDGEFKAGWSDDEQDDGRRGPASPTSDTMHKIISYEEGQEEPHH